MRIEDSNWDTTKKPIIAFDFDGVIAVYDSWRGEDVFGIPIPETVELMQKLFFEGYQIHIFTCRSDTPAMRRYLKVNEIPYHEYIGDKPYYKCFVDDRTVNNTLVPNTEELVRKVLSK